MSGEDLFEKEIHPMLAQKTEPFNDENWIYELKFDGTRCLAFIDTTKHLVKLQNRRLKQIGYRYPELQEIWKNVNAEKVILDGEIVVLKGGKPDFKSLQKREHTKGEFKIDLLSKRMPATYFVFDILYLDGDDLTSSPLKERKEKLDKIVREDSNLAVVDYVRGKGKKLFKKAKKEGFEGVMAKKADSPYLRDKRSDYWLKIKSTQTLDCVITGYTTGSGRRKRLVGSLILGCYDEGELVYLGKVGTGFSQEDLKMLKEKLKPLRTDESPFDKKPELELPAGREYVWTEPKLVCEVEYLELTESKHLRAPVFKGLRKDKNPPECKLPK